MSYYAASAGKAAYWTQDTWTASSETWTGQSVHYDNGTEYDVVIGAASDSFSFYTVGKDAAGTVRQQTVVNADGSTVVLGSDSAGHIDSRTVLQADGGFDQEVVNAAGQTSAIVSHGADASQIVQAFTTGGAPGAAQTLSYQSLYDAAGVETDALLVGKDGSRDEETYGAGGQVLTASVTRADGTLVSKATYGAGGVQTSAMTLNSDGSRSEETYGAGGQVLTASVTRADGTLVSAATYGAGGVETSATTLNADGSHTVLGFDAAGHVQTVSFTHDDGSGASFVVEAGGSTTAGQAVLNQVSVSLAEQILAQPADDKHTVSQKVTLPDGELYDITMGAAGNIVAKHEHPGALESLVEEVAGPVLNALAFIPPLTPFVAPLAAAYDAAQAGEDFSQGNVLGGVLNLGSAVGVGAVGVAAIASGGGFGSGVAQNLVSLSGAGSANALKVVGLEVLEGTAFVGGASGVAQGAASGDPLAIAAGGLEMAAAGISGLVSSGQLDPALGADAAGIAAAKATSLLAGQVALGAGLGSAALGGADGLEHGDVLGSIGGLLAAAASSGQAVADDLFGTAVVPAQTGAGSQGAAGGPDVLPGAQGAGVQPVTQEDLPAPGGTTNAATTTANAGGTDAAGGGAATGGSGAAGTSGGAPAGTGQFGSGAGYAPGGSQQSGGLPTNGVTVDASGMVHVDIDPVKTGYVPTTGASTTSAGLSGQQNNADNNLQLPPDSGSNGDGPGPVSSAFRSVFGTVNPNQWAAAGALTGAAAGGAIGSTAGAGIGVLTGPFAPVVLPGTAVEGGVLGAAGGAVVGGAIGLVAGGFVNYMEGSGDSGTNTTANSTQNEAVSGSSTSDGTSGDKAASTPTGQRGSPIDVTPGTNQPTEIGGRLYTGHGLDQMQGRGVPPSAVEDAIQNGQPSSGNTPGTTVYSGKTGIVVVTGSNGQVITVVNR